MNSFSAVTASLIMITAPAAGLAQSATLTAPRLGYLFDSEGKSIRTLSGIPGAASLETGLSVASKLDGAFISPNRKFALGQPREGDQLLLVAWSGDTTTVTPLEGAPAGTGPFAFSVSGSTAVLWNSTAQKLQIWKGLPTSPSLLKELDSSQPGALAVSDDGEVTVIASEAGLTVAGVGRVLATGTFSGIAFLPGTHDLAAAESAADQVLLIRHADSDPETTQLASGLNGVAQPVALDFSNDGRRLIVANLRGQSVLSIDLESLAMVLTPCNCQADGLYRAQGNAVFRLTNGSQDQIALFDGDGSEPRVLNIPTGVSR